jgi:hypothetical protein
LELEEEENPMPDAAEDWRRPYIDYLLHDILPDERTEARRWARPAKSHILVSGELYKRSHTGILQRCIPIEQGRQLLIDINAGVCGHHAAPRTLVRNILRQGFYWPTAVADAELIVRTCEGCQFYARQTHMPEQVFQTINITWPFAVWELDMIGPLTKALGGYTHLLVAVDKFTNKIEAKPITSLKSAQATAFFQDIVHHFGVPNFIITDNGINFIGKFFLEFCDDHHIRVDWAAVAHPRTKGQVERTNDMVLQGLKPRINNRLQKFPRRWVAELPAVLWRLRTTPSWATGFTPFFMVYGSEAILPTDLEYGSLRVKAYDEQGSDAAIEGALDQLDEARDIALL